MINNSFTIKKQKAKNIKLFVLSCDQCNDVFGRKFEYSLFVKHHFCNKNCSFIAFKKGGMIDLQKTNNNIKNHGIDYCSKLPSVKIKQKQTNLKKYNVEHPMHLDFVKNKIKQTNLRNTGFTCNLQCEKSKNKIKQTNLKKYGFEQSAKNSLVKQKAKQTLDSKTEIQKLETKERIKQTFLKKYNVENPMYLEFFKNKIKQTNITRYNVDHVWKSVEIRQKCFKTAFESNISNVSKIEDIFNMLLLANGFLGSEIKRQVFVNKWIIDFYITDLNLYIQIDGVYWHGLDRNIEKIKQFKNPRDENIYKKILSDKEQNLWFKNKNKRLVRITDLEIKKFVKTIRK